ncbi:MAG: cyclic nucleotide-binding domain-containing protein [Deltaproteobacteria bacterium]|nr:cyclic nucleotide-binding domain-containing protein [Deltaproteobacteria bacterium]
MNEQGKPEVGNSGEPAGFQALNHDLNIVVVDPDRERCQKLAEQLKSLDMVKMVGMRTTPHFLIDIFSEYTIDLVIYEESVGWENIFESVREVRIHPGAGQTGYMLIADSIGPEVLRSGSQAGILGFLQKPFNENLLKRAILDAMGQPDPNMISVLEDMRNLHFFARFSDRDLLRLLNICPTRTYKKGDFLFREGDEGSSMFVLLSGEVGIYKTQDGADKLVSVLSPGDCIGEMAVVDDSPRSADARINSYATIFEIEKRTITEDDSKLALRLSRQIGTELANKIRKMYP